MRKKWNSQYSLLTAYRAPDETYPTYNQDKAADGRDCPKPADPSQAQDI